MQDEAGVAEGMLFHSCNVSQTSADLPWCAESGVLRLQEWAGSWSIDGHQEAEQHDFRTDKKGADGM